MSKTKMMDKDKLELEKYKIIHISIDNYWQIGDFMNLLSSFNSIYNLYFNYFEILKTKVDVQDIKYGNMLHYRSVFIKNITAILKNQNIELNYSFNDKYIFSKLGIKSIKYSSPGFTDLVGVAQVIEHIKDILFHYLPNKKTKKEIEVLEQERIKLMIDNLKSIGLENNEIQRIILFRNLFLLNIRELIDDKKIASIDTYDDMIDKISDTNKSD